jgi:hypothetical protein
VQQAWRTVENWPEAGAGSGEPGSSALKTALRV